MTRRFHTLIWIAVLAALYYWSGTLGLSLAFVNPSTTAVWPPAGIALAALLLAGNRLWPGIFLGAFLVNITRQSPADVTVAMSIGKTIGIAIGNTLEPLAAAWFVRRFARGLKVFEQPQTIFKFVSLAGLLSTTISATFGVISLCLGSFAEWDRFSAIWLTWWLGDMVSNLIVAPLLILWTTEPLPRMNSSKILEFAGLVLCVVAVGTVVFGGMHPFGDRHLPLEYFGIPPLLWASFRFGRRGAVSCAFLMSAIALWSTVHGLGPFVRVDPNESLLLLQAFMGTITIVALVLASIVAERRKAQMELARANIDLEHRVQERTAELRETNTHLEDFVHSMAHDLRAPLRSMSSFSKLLLTDCSDRLDETGKDYVKRIARSAEMMDVLLLDLLAYGRVARSEMILTSVDVEAAWSQALAQYDQLIKEKRAHVEVTSELPCVRGHEATLTQVLANLLGNALKFVRPEIAPHVRFWAEPHPDYVRFWLADNGVGIAPEHYERMFHLFEQLNGRKYGGTGIGLSIVRKGVERMGGRVGVESEPGHGSRFWIELPRT